MRGDEGSAPELISECDAGVTRDRDAALGNAKIGETPGEVPQQITSIFQVASQASPKERAGLLEKDCGSDSSISRNVRSLLENYERLAEPPLIQAAHLPIPPQGSSLIGKYQIEGALGRGGFGAVFRARDTVMGRQVAIKVLSTIGDTAMAGRFRAEAGTTAGFRHKNIVTVHDYGDHFGQPYFVMELLDGRSLDHVIRDGPSLSIWEKVNILLQIADGLNYAHQLAVVHRDIKPGNVMLLAGDAIKILDFGISRFINKGQTRHTLPGMITGTLEYMAPELLLGDEADAVSDVFSWAVLAYELISGTQPFRADSPTRTIYLLSEFEPPPLDAIVQNCPPELQKIIQTAMAKCRSERYPTIREILFDLAPIETALRRSRSEELAIEGNDHLAKGQLDQAQSAAEQSLQLDPTNEHAQELRRSVKTKRKRLLTSGPRIDEARGISAYQRQRAAKPKPTRTVSEAKSWTMRLGGVLIPAIAATFALRMFFNASPVTGDRPLGAADTLVVFMVFLFLAVVLRYLVNMANRALRSVRHR